MSRTLRLLVAVSALATATAFPALAHGVPTPTPTATTAGPATRKAAPSVSLAQPTSPRGPVRFTVSGLAPGGWLDVNGFAVGKQGEAAYHYELKADDNGRITRSIPAPDGGWTREYRFQFTLTDGTTVSRTVSPVPGTSTRPTTGAKSSDGGLAKTGR